MPHITTIPCITDSIGEDEASHDRHTKILSLEWKKSKPNKHAVSELMRRTFTVRRERIMSSPVPMDSLLSTYPPLRQYKEVSDIDFLSFVSFNSVGYNVLQLVSELDRIVGRHVSQGIREGWLDLVPKLITLAKEEHDNATIATIRSDIPVDIHVSDGK